MPVLSGTSGMPRIGKDKYYHFLFGILSVILLSLFFGVGWVILIASVGWLAKEIVWDGLLGMGTVDAWDFFASLLGIMIGAIIILGIEVYKNWKKKKDDAHGKNA